MVYLFYLVFQAKSNCPGDVPLQNGICPEFVCLDRSSCDNHGNCSSDGTTCDCDEGFSGTDCSFDLDGEKYVTIRLLYLFCSCCIFFEVLVVNYST